MNSFSCLLRGVVFVFLCSLFQPFITGVGFAQSVAEEQEEQTLQKVDAVETFVDKIADVVEVKVKNEELLERFEQKKEEMEELLEETKEEIEASGVSDSQESKDIIQELKKTVYLKTYSGLTDHDGIDDIVQVEGGALEQEQAQETAIESMQGEDSGGHPSYTVMIKSSFSQEQIEKKLSPFIEEEKQLQIELLFEDDGVVFFELKVDQESLLGEELLGDVEEGDIPDHLLGIEVIKPEILEIGQVMVAGLQGEKNGDLRGMDKYKTSAYQGGLHSKKKISVAVIDTGIDASHPDLKQNISRTINGYDFVNKDADPMDDHIHGTHVAGTIGAALDGKGVYGVNTNADLVALKICTKYGYCPTYAITKAVKYAADKGVDVLNMSLGGRGSVKNNPVCQAISYAVKKGSIVIAAAGNANRPVSQYIPGACPDAITVGAVDKNLKRARFSNYGPGVDVSAPGVGILSTVPGNKWKSLDGTSMATPHVAGLASAILSYNPKLSQSQMRALLKKATIKVNYESGKMIGGFVDMPTLMGQGGAKQYSHAYKIPGTTGVAVSNKMIGIQGYDDEGMQVSTKKVTLKVGETKTVRVSGRGGTVNIWRNYKGTVMLGTPGKGMSGQSADRTSVRIASTEDEEVDEEGGKEDDVEITEDYNEMTEEEKLKLDAEAVDETRESEQDILQEKMNEEEITLDERQDIIELAGVKKTVNLQVTGLKPGKNTIFLIDGDGKKLQIEVITTERIVTVKQGTDVGLRMPVWLTATNTNRWIKAKQNHDGYGVAYSRRNSRTGQLYYVSGKMLGTYTIQLPVRNTASRKKDDRFGIMQVTVNVATAREDSQAQRQQKAKAFSMSHDQLQMNVGQTIHIGLDGYGPFQVRRKGGGVVGYVGSTGGTRVASAGEEEEDEGSEDLITIKDEFSSNITDKEREIFQQSSEMLVDTGAIQMGSGGFYLLEGEEFKKNPDADEGGGEGEEQIEIASAGKQGFTIVGLVPGDEILYVTDIKGRTQNIVVQVKETDLKTYLDEESSKRSVRGEETVKKEIGRRGGESYERFGESRQRLGYVYGLSARYYWNKKYLKNAYGNRQKTRVKYFSINALPTSPGDIAVTFLNTYEQGADTTRRNERKYTQQMKFSTNKKTQPVKKLSYPDSYYDVPDYFTANGTIKMQVGQMKTIQVGSQGGNYSYWKANHNIGWINGTSQNVRVANAGGTEATGELIDGDTVVGEDDKDLTDIGSGNLLEIPAEIGEEEVTQEMLQEIDQRGEEQDPESDVSYEENTVAPEGDVEIASVNGKAATFVALRPGISYIYVKYSNGRSEKMKVIISPKVITKNYNQTLNLTSTGNLAIRKMWSKTKKWEQLSFSKKPKKRRTANDTYRRLKASSIVGNDTLYVQIYNRVERKFMYLELHTKVNKPPITSSFKSLNMTVGQTTLIRAAGGAGKLSIIKGNDRIGRIKNTHKDIEVASAGSGGVNEHSEEERVIQSYTGLVDDGVDVEPDLEVEVVPTKEQLAMVPDKSETGTGDDESDRAPTEATSGSGTVQIASNWRMTVPLQALRPGRVDVVVTDQHKQSRRINLNVLPKVITKKRGESLKLNAPYDLPIMYVKTKAKTEITYKKRPKGYRYGGKWEIDTTNFQPIETVYVRHYNRKEKKYQRVELTVKTETQPLKVSTEKVDRIRSGSMNTVTITGGVVPYKITQTGNASVSISHGKGKTTKDNNLHYMVLKGGRTVFIITDAQGKKKTVTVTSQMDEIQVKQRDKLSFNGSEGMPIKSVSSKSGVHYAYKQSGLNMSVETEKMDKNDTLVIHVEDKVMGRGFSYEVDLIVTALTTLDPPEGTGWEYCAEHNQSCDFRGSYIVAYGNKGKFNEKRYETGSAVCTHTTFGDPYPGMRKGCWIKEVSKLTVSKSALSVTAGEIVTVKVFGGTPSYTINKANHNIMLADSASGGVKIASAEEEGGDSDEFVIGSVEEEYEELPVDDTGELVPLPTDEELEALAQIQGPEVLSTGELDNETGGEETGLEIASVGKAIHIMGLVPGKSKVTIIDQYKRTVSIDITVKPTTLLKQPGDIVTVYSTKEIPIRFVRLYNKQPQMEASPKSWTQGGAWNIKTHNFNSKETLRPLIYSTGEKRYYWMSLDVQLKEVKKMPEQQEPILYLPFDGNTKDKIGNYDLSEQGKIAYVEGIQGKGVKLGTSWLSIPHHIGPQITGNMTVSFWIRPDTFVGRQNPLSKSYGGEISFTQEPNGRISTYFGLKGTNGHPYAGFRPGDEVKKGEWNHVTMVKNIKTMKRQVYVNGKKTERGIPTAFTKASAGGSELKIGKGYAGMYKGTMDELRIYNRSLSEKEVQELRSLKKEPKTIVPQQEPIGHRTFDETTNESKKSYTTSVSGSPLYGEGAIGKSLQLGKTTLSIPASIGEEMTGDLTVSMWLKPDSFAERMNPIAKAYGGEFTMTQEPSGRMTGFFGTRGGNGSPYTGMHSKNSVTLKKWNHVAFVRDLKAKKFWMYVNGDRTEKAIPSSFLQPKLSANALTIGKGYVKPYEGSIDDLRIYNRALSEKEIGELWGMKKEESTPIYNPKLESLSLPGLGFAFATVQRDVVPKSAQIEYSKGGTEKVEITDKASVALIDEKKGEWKITYVKSDGKKGEVKRGVSIASVGDEGGGLEIASAVQDGFDDTWGGRICTTKRGAKFYKAYKSTCEVGHESTARNCFVGLREYEVNNDLIQGESCLNPYTNLKNEDQYNRIIKKIVDEGRKNEGSRKKEILSILERFVENNLEMKTESIFLYIHDHVASGFSVPEVTEDFRKKLMESGEKMRKKKKTVGVSSNNILELYSYFTRKVWPDWGEWDFKNIDVNKGGYGGYANLIMGGKIFKVDDPGNINFGYAGKMGELSLKVIIKGSLYAQYGVDLKIMDPDGNEVKMDTPDNEKLDALSIIRGYLLGVKYPGNNLPISYIDDLYGFDIEKYAESIGLSSFNDESSNTIYYLTPGMILKK